MILINIKNSNKLGLLIAQEDSYWRQRAKIFWMKDEDTNSKFFHASANARKKINSISSLSRGDGTAVHDHKGICDVVISYFNDLFQPQNNYNNFFSVINKMSPCVSHYDNDFLLPLFTMKEFKSALFPMDSDKSTRTRWS